MVEESKKSCPTLRKVPPKHTRAVASRIALLASVAMLASDPVAKERALKMFFLFPRMIFQAPLRNKNNGRNSKSLYNARTLLVGNRLDADPQSRFLEYQASLQPSDRDLRRSTRVQAQETDFDKHLSNEIMRNVHEGYISRASSLASSPGLAQPGNATAQVLRDLWSRVVHRPSSPWNPPSAYERNNIKVAMENNLHRSLRTAAKGSGAGLTGWRFEYLAPLLRASGQEWEPFENLAAAIASGDVPLWVREVLSLGRATALKKGATGVRPLVCHEPLRRLLTRALIFDVHEDIQAHVGPNQFAVGISGGCPAMALSVQKLAHKHRNLVFFQT